uniref:Tyrosine--tRNA ligase n=1 Tax=uncultured delta proteobacterium HF0070_10I02 TaxID=710824 RepID=E0XS29_9DELT|nr:tyrosyl-tRNA synthetase [uncultured delta proteobacterium HF0070_10I02]
MNAIDTLTARGFIKTHTDLDALNEAMAAGPITFYVGFDPTGDSLHIGHLLPVMAMAHLQQAGHKPIVVLGGGTAMVGDPSGKDKTREILTPEKIRSNLEAMRVQFGRFLELERCEVVDNAEWLMGLGYIHFLRDVGKHFSVNKMMSAEGIRQRLERNQGLSFIEFNYHLLQSYDFLVLHDKYGCTLQLGGDDQWFNILGGVELIRRERQQSAHALTIPLLQTADGKKMGKTEKGATWLDPNQCSPYDYFQYWVNVHDADVGRFLRLYTFMPLDEIAKLEALEGAQIRDAKQVLAFEATALAHGKEEAEKARAAAQAAFSGGVSADMPSHAVGFPVNILDALVATGLCKSKGDARRQIQQGAVRLGADRDQQVIDTNHNLDAETVLWKGKKNCFRLVAQ